MAIARFKPFLCLAALLVAIAASATARAQNAGAAERTRVLCTACHRDQFAALERNPHSALGAADRLVCVECHSGVDAHIAAGGGSNTVFAFRDEPPREQAAQCLTCHASTHPGYAQSAHAGAGLACGSCHEQHGDAALPPRALLKDLAYPDSSARVGPASAVCTDCHGEIATQFAFNERHRLTEGALECVSCHDPHASQTRSLLGGFKQEQCTDCHTDKRGPFVFEHAASRVEGCTACHAAHGSPNRHMLTHQRVAETCYACHPAVPQFHLGFGPGGPPRFGLQTQCTNCHSSIHGSNFEPMFLR